MEKLDFKTITNKEDLEHVIHKVEQYTTVRLPESYVNKSKVVGVFLHNKLVAGYLLVTTPQFRSLSFVPDVVKGSDTFFDNDPYEMMEVNGLWISPALKTPSLQVRVWAHLIRDIFLSRKKYVLLMRNSKNKCMEKLTGMANPQVLFQGPPNLMAGEKTHNTIEVAFTTRWNILLNSHKYLFELYKRTQKAARFNKRQKSLSNLEPQATEVVGA